ncbi:unnamed protein product [Mytilus edulis]|uniref:Uncharacterized protein n=1 Tax=Mytilus edulis TaxID=6550 RepID=A0A8S3SHL5_MYTED|nr:unnamed protein product [Mytilus edulis]
MSDNWIIINIKMFIDRSYLTGLSQCRFGARAVQYRHGADCFGRSGKQLSSNSSNIIPKIVTTKVTWPNEISGVPRSVFNKSMVAIPDGFLVPFKTDGSISLVDIDGKGPYKLTDDQTGKWFYHRVVWKDMDLDGDLDILTCRAREPVIGIG